MAYDKTIFKPEEVGTLDQRYRLSVVGGGQSDASLKTEDGSASEGSSTNETSNPPSQFDLGDFSNLKPAAPEGDAAAQKDELPVLGGAQ